MKTLNEAILELNLTVDERNTFSQLMRPAVWEKHFKKLSNEKLLTLKNLFEKQFSKYNKLFSVWGTAKLYNYCNHCEYALSKINAVLDNHILFEALPTTAYYSEKQNKTYDSIALFVKENIYNKGMIEYCFAKFSPLTAEQREELKKYLLNFKNGNIAEYDKNLEKWVKEYVMRGIIK